MTTERDEWTEARQAGKPGWFLADDGATEVDITGGLGSYVNLPGRLRVFDVPDAGRDVEFRVELIAPGRMRPTAVSLISRTGDEVTSTEWRRVNIQELWRAYAPRIVTTFSLHLPSGEQRPQGIHHVQGKDLELMRAWGTTSDATVRYVANLYRVAAAIGLAPVKYVMDAFTTDESGPLPRTTATGWVRRARDVGFLGDDDA